METKPPGLFGLCSVDEILVGYMWGLNISHVMIPHHQAKFYGMYFDQVIQSDNFIPKLEATIHL